MLHLIGRLPLTSGPFLWAIGVAAIGALATSVGWRHRRWRSRYVPLVAAGSAAVVTAFARVTHIADHVGSTFPRSFYVWMALPVFASGIAALGWRTAAHWRRVLSIATIPVLAAFGAALVNQHYAYVPTLADLAGARMHDQVDAVPPITGVAPDTGTIVQLDIPATVSHFAHRPAFVWLPPAWFTLPHPALPVVEVIAGVPGQPANMIRAGDAGRAADAYARAHGGLAPILVFPDQNGSFTGDTECVDGPRGAAETYLTVDVIDFARQQLGASGAAGSAGILGYSEGGTCALVLSLRHPALFASFVDIGGDRAPNVGPTSYGDQRLVRELYGGDASQVALHDPLTLLAHHRFDGLAAWFEDGRSDHRPLAVARQLDTAAVAAGIDARLIDAPGGHDFRFVTKTIASSLSWMADRLLRPQ